MKTSAFLTILTSASASLCCIVPFVAIIGGSGSMMASISWLESFRPFFIGGTLLFLGFAWFKTIKTSKTDCCGCEQTTSFFQSKKFLSIVTAFSLLLISFPSYSSLFIQSRERGEALGLQDKNQTRILSVSGMTCASCEHHIESAVVKVSGVASVKASYADGSTTVFYDPEKTDETKIISAINSIGYKVEQKQVALKPNAKADCCAKGLCTPESCSTMPKVSVPNERSKNLKVLSGIDQIKDTFNKRSGKVKFVAILSSTCGWCLQGAQAIQQTVIEKMAQKDISVIIVWTNMLKSDDKENAYKAASLFDDPSIVQYFDADNKFGDLVAQRLNPEGQKAWDIYMFFDKEDQWNKSIPRPFEYAHQLSADLHPWADNTKYFCGKDLTKRLGDITASL